MSRNMKIILGIVGGIVVCCSLSIIVGIVVLPRVATNFFEESFIEDPEQAASVMEEIIDYELPAGYVEEGGMSFFGIDMVFASAPTVGEGVIMIMSFPEALASDEEEMQSQMEQAFRRQMGRQDMHLVYKGTEDAVINGESAVLSIYEGTDENGVDVRQMTGIFQTKGSAPGMLMIFGTLDSWEEQGFEDFIASME